MDEVLIKSNQIEKYVNMVSEELASIDTNNFDQSMNNINKLIERINSEREYLKETYSIEGGVPQCDGLHRAVKHVISQFDNIIERKKESSENIITELNKLSNKKKLIKYQRW